MPNLVRVSNSGKAPEQPINFSYTGSIQSFTVPKTGTYQLEVWGAQGGHGGTTKDNGYKSYGGSGGYAKGNVKLTKNEVIYICVGQAGKDMYLDFSAMGRVSGGYNGGGNGLGSEDSEWHKYYWAGPGGGATHIGKQNAILKNTSVANLLIVAGGGGGAGCSHSDDASGSTESGGSGGGTTGGTGSGYGSGYGGGGTQSAVGSGGSGGGYGQGAGNAGGGGGGGYYGGGAGGNYNGNRPGGGGSGYIGGCIAGTTSMTNGVRSGNGYATITYVGR